MATFNDAYLELRSKLRKFNRNSLLEAVFQTLRAPYADKFTELQSAPWQTMLLAKWILQDGIMDRSTGVNISQPQFNELRQWLWDMPGQVDSGPDENRPGMLFMRQILRAQIGFQRELTPGFVREAAMLATLSPQHGLRTLWNAKTGMDIEEFLALQYAMYSIVLSKTLSFSAADLGNIEAAFQPGQIPRFLDLISRDAPQLCDYVRTLPGAKEKKLSEFFEFPRVSRFPFLRIGDKLHCWHPYVFYRGLEDLVHSVMAEAGQDYIDSFSKLFERHVVAEAESVGATFYSESDLRKWNGEDSEVPDGLLSYPDCNVLIESKAGLFDEEVMTVGHSEIFKRKTRALQKAASQAWTMSAAFRRASAVPSQVATAGADYLLIVTNKELSASRGDHLAKLYPAGTLEPKDPATLAHLPLEHIYIVSIEDYERITCAARDGHLSIPDFLAQCVQADSNPADAKLYMHQHLDKAKVLNGRSRLVNEALEQCHRRLESVLRVQLKVMSPKALNPRVEMLLKHLGLAPRDAAYLKYTAPTAFDPQAKECHFNARLMCRHHGGSVQTGWTIGEDTTEDFIEAQYHAVWRAPEGSLVDVTPRADREETVLFIPDATRHLRLTNIENRPAIDTFDNVRFMKGHIMTDISPVTMVLDSDFIYRNNLVSSDGRWLCA